MIERFQKGPRMSQAVKAGNMIFLAGQVPDDFEADLETQTRQVLAKIDGLLAAAGANKSHIVSATVYLAHITDFNGMNAVYDRWIDPENPPARACVEARLAHPGIRVEIVCVAALPQ
ncbi:RidA family protein [Chelativorans sp.]|uniref:RidA family protein n=1 Tax=Chelativorans sp. TaxID=2203393 RepID=UPI002810CB39|nr:RidA family protein [Chelativorans sp.]